MDNMEAVILAGGKGARLKPYTAEIPKPLVTVGDHPVIEILLHRLKKASVKTVHLAVNHLAHLIMAALGDGSRWGMDINYHQEETPLSTVGPIKLINDLPSQFLVVNGDILTDMDFRQLYNQHCAGNALLTIATYRRTVTNDYGTLEVDSHGLATAFHEKPSFDFIVSTGVYIFSRDVLKYVPFGQPFGFDNLMETLLLHKEPVATYPFDGYWLDIGRVDDYEQANRDTAVIDRLLG